MLVSMHQYLTRIYYHHHYHHHYCHHHYCHRCCYHQRITTITHNYAIEIYVIVKNGGKHTLTAENKDINDTATPFVCSPLTTSVSLLQHCLRWMAGLLLLCNSFVIYCFVSNPWGRVIIIIILV